MKFDPCLNFGRVKVTKGRSAVFKPHPVQEIKAECLIFKKARIFVIPSNRFYTHKKVN